MGIWDSFKSGGFRPTTNTPKFNDWITPEEQSKIERKIEKQVEKFSPELADKLRNFNEKTDNFNQTLENAKDAIDPLSVVTRLVTKDKNFKPADHLYVQRMGYTHHALYIGNNEVIHYLQDEGIVIYFLEDFARGANIHKKDSPKYYSDDEVINRAFSRLHENQYNLAYNNCENFVHWCRSGRE